MGGSTPWRYRDVSGTVAHIVLVAREKEWGYNCLQENDNTLPYGQ